LATEEAGTKATEAEEAEGSGSFQNNPEKIVY